MQSKNIHMQLHIAIDISFLLKCEGLEPDMCDMSLSLL